MNIDFSKYVENIKNSRIVKMEAVRSLSRQYGISIIEVEKTLLQNDVIPYRYSGNVKLFGADGQYKLLSSTVSIIGSGGLGGSIIELCARLGIGKLVLCDGDKFEESNLNRQLMSTESFIGKYKVECAKERVKSINSALEVASHTEFIDKDNVKSIIEGSGCVIDGLDNIESRFILQDACGELSIPLVHGAIGGTLVHVTAVVPGDNTLDSLYSREMKKGEEPSLGNPMVTVALCASLEVAEAVKILLGKGEGLRKKLLHVDWLYGDFNIFSV